MLSAAAAPLSFWDCAVLNAVDVANRVVHSLSNSIADPDKTACELLTLTKPSILDLHPFGCRAYVTKPPPQLSDETLDERAWEGIAVGNSSTTIGAVRV